MARWRHVYENYNRPLVINIAFCRTFCVHCNDHWLFFDRIKIPRKIKFMISLWKVYSCAYQRFLKDWIIYFLSVQNHVLVIFSSNYQYFGVFTRWIRNFPIPNIHRYYSKGFYSIISKFFWQFHCVLIFIISLSFVVIYIKPT